MAISFVHLSDIHFGQEKGGELHTHNDAKQRLIADARHQVRDRSLTIQGIIVTGDVAYAGRDVEFKEAGKWLDELSEAVGCSKTSVQVVPGNHDIDRSEISGGCQMMLADIAANGEHRLDTYLNKDVDREVLYKRLGAYLSFAEGYNCVLDKAGGIASNLSFPLAVHRSLRFIGLNSALACSSADEEGKLILGAKQRAFPKNDGEEVVVLCHHPLHWLQDSATARKYIQNRARVLMTGHEHKPSLAVEAVRDGCDLLTLASGAAVPPHVRDGYTYTYNILTFDWDEKADALAVTIVPRTWSEDELDFDDDKDLLEGLTSPVVLGSPNFREMAKNIAAGQGREPATTEHLRAAHAGESEIVMVEESAIPERFALVLLRFFRDLSPSQRIEVLVRLDALPRDWTGNMTHSMERAVVDRLVGNGRIAQLEDVIDRALQHGPSV